MTRARYVSNPQAIDIPLTVSANLTANAVITVGNSSVNSVITSNTYSIGSNVSLNTSRLFLGNSTVNSVHTASTLDVGANVNLSTVGLNVGSNTVNAYINSTSFAIGNSTVNTAITSTTITTPSANINSSVADFVQPNGTETFRISRSTFNNGQNISLYSRSSGNFLTFSSNLNNAKQAVIENYVTGNTTAESSISLRIDGTDKLKANSTLVYISTDLTTTGTANVSTAINIGANVNLSTTYMDVGNSTVNTTITNITVSTNTVNVASIINVGANVNLSTSQINVGNSTVNTVISAASLTTTSNTVSIGTAAYFVANGNVGIGTSSPAYRLDVNGDLKVVNAVRYFVGATQYGVTFANAGAVGTEAYQGTYIYWGTGASTSATERMRLETSGNLGVGTTSPKAPLHVVASAGAANDKTLIIQDKTAGNAGEAWLSFKAQESLDDERIKGAIVYANGGSAYGVGNLLFCMNSTADNSNATTANEKMRLDSSGNLLVGTTSLPSGGGIVTASSSAAETKVSIVNTGTSGRHYWLGSTNDSSGSLGGGKFGIFDQTANAARLVIDSSGNLGVGTTSPSTGKFSDASYAFLIQSASTSTGTNIFASNSDNSKYIGLWSGHSGAEPAIGVKTGNALTFGKWAAINGTGGFTENMRITSSGELQVNSNLIVTGITYTSGFYFNGGGTQNILTIYTGEAYLFYSVYTGYGAGDNRHGVYYLAGVTYQASTGVQIAALSGTGTFSISSGVVSYSAGGGNPTTVIWWQKLSG